VPPAAPSRACWRRVSPWAHRAVKPDAPRRRCARDPSSHVYEHLVPVSLATAEEYLALDEVGRIYADLRENGEDVTVGVSTTADRDVFTLAIGDRPLAAT
jgi:hypothetical protein